LIVYCNTQSERKGLILAYVRHEI